MRRPPLRISRRGFVALAIAGIVLPTVLLATIGFALVHRSVRFQNEILQNYSRFSVEHTRDEIERRVVDEERDIAAYMQLTALTDPFVPEFELRRVELEHPLIQHAFLRQIDGTIVQARRVAASGDSCRALEFAEARARAARIVRRTFDDGSFEHILLANEVHYYVGREGDHPYHLVAFPGRDAANRPRGVLGFFLSEERARQYLIPRILETAIHASEGRFAPEFGEVLTFVVLDDGGRPVFAHQHDEDAGTRHRGRRYLAQAELDDVFPGWRVRITYANASRFAWSKHILGLQSVFLGLALGLVLLGTLFTIRFSLRQMELSRLKSHFVSNITHELKTPLAAIRLYTETLQQGRVRDRAESSRFLGIIHKETVRLTALINNILDFARIEDGRRRYRFARASVADVVRDVTDAYAFQLSERGCSLNLDIEADLPLARIDRDAVAQAVLNLLDNAVKYSQDDKRIDVTVAAETDAAGQDGARHIAVRVRDHGIGIPAAEQKQIFDAFYRVEKGLQHDVKGSGLGLTVVQHVAEAHGGRITVESQPGEGSTFTLRLPAEDAADSGPRNEPAAGEPWQRSA